MPVAARGRQPEAKLLTPTVKRVVNLSEDLYLLILEGFPEEFDPQPGMFLHLRVSPKDHPLLRRPFSIQDYTDGAATLLIRVVGIGTEILRKLRPGDRVDALGPLGTRFSQIEKEDRVLMVGGGVGVAPLIASCAAADPGGEADFCYGVRNEAEVQGVDPFKDRAESIRIHVSTDDGSMGYKGFNTDVAARLLQENKYTKTFTCGPWIMMRKTAELAERYDLPFEASLEVQMGCGLGACLACVYESTEGPFIRSCIDGPVVDGRKVVWGDR
jgi:dihydroorotate dehydrogenase electron transfer subunit